MEISKYLILLLNARKLFPASLKPLHFKISYITIKLAAAGVRAEYNKHFKISYITIKQFREAATDALLNFKISYITIKLSAIFSHDKIISVISKYLILLLNRITSPRMPLKTRISKYLILLLNRDDRLRCCGTHTISKYLILLLNPDCYPVRCNRIRFQNILYYY